MTTNCLTNESILDFNLSNVKNSNAESLNNVSSLEETTILCDNGTLIKPIPMISFKETAKADSIPMISFKEKTTVDSTSMIFFEEDTEVNSTSMISFKENTIPSTTSYFSHDKDITTSSNSISIPTTNDKLDYSNDSPTELKNLSIKDSCLQSKDLISKNISDTIELINDTVLNAQQRVKEKAKALSATQTSIENTSFCYDGTYLMLDNDYICNFTIIIEEEIRLIDANSSQYFSRYKTKVTVNNNVFETTVNGVEFDQYLWVKKLTSGKAFIIGETSDYRSYIHYLISTSKAPITYRYNRSGWVIRNEKNYYITSAGPIGVKNNNITTTDGKVFNFIPEQIGKKEIFQCILELMLYICKDNEKSIVLELFTHLGVLTTLFEESGFPPKFVMGLIGETNSRKTSLAIAVTQLFNRDTLHTPELSFSSTIGGIETMLQTYSDAVLLVDDLMPTNTKSQQNDINNKLEFLVRAYGDRVSKRRMTDFSNNNAKSSYPIRGTCLITGEYVEGVTSSMTRMVNIYLDKKQVNNDILSFHQQNPNILSTHFYDFISYITDTYHETVQYIEQRIPALRLENSPYFNTSRYAESFAHLQTVSELFINYGVQRGFINNDESNYYLLIFEKAIRKVIKENDSDVSNKNIGIMFLVALNSALEDSSLKCFNLNEPRNSEKDFVLYDDYYIYIKPDLAFLVAKKYWSIYDRYLPITSSGQLIQYLLSLGVIVEKTEGNKKRHTLKLPKRKADDNTRYIYIIKSIMYEKLAEAQDL